MNSKNLRIYSYTSIVIFFNFQQLIDDVKLPCQQTNIIIILIAEIVRCQSPRIVNRDLFRQKITEVHLTDTKVWMIRIFVLEIVVYISKENYFYDFLWMIFVVYCLFFYKTNNSKLNGKEMFGVHSQAILK